MSECPKCGGELEYHGFANERTCYLGSRFVARQGGGWELVNQHDACRIRELTSERDRMKSAIEGAMRIKDLWAPGPEFVGEHAGEGLALQMMLDGFTDALQPHPDVSRHTPERRMK